MEDKLRQFACVAGAIATGAVATRVAALRVVPGGAVGLGRGRRACGGDRRVRRERFGFRFGQLRFEGRLVLGCGYEVEVLHSLVGRRGGSGRRRGRRRLNAGLEKIVEVDYLVLGEDRTWLAGGLLLEHRHC